jgi:hypothetical protein
MGSGHGSVLELGPLVVAGKYVPLHGRDQVTILEVKE